MFFLSNYISFNSFDKSPTHSYPSIHTPTTHPLLPHSFTHAMFHAIILPSTHPSPNQPNDHTCTPTHPPTQAPTPRSTSHLSNRVGGLVGVADVGWIGMDWYWRIRTPTRKDHVAATHQTRQQILTRDFSFSKLLLKRAHGILRLPECQSGNSTISATNHCVPTLAVGKLKNPMHPFNTQLANRQTSGQLLSFCFVG